MPTLLSRSRRAWDFAGRGFRITAAISFGASISASDGPPLVFRMGSLVICNQSEGARVPSA